MSKIRPIEDLSKEELLSLIYNNMPNTRYKDKDHPCECAACGEEEIKGNILGFICDECENDYYNLNYSLNQFY
jgi:hypothetical protein